ncbi:60 kDa SS-A/Ro ribonucleoprotein [Galendromus occidentalis]|uniref:60 kDa SS-A/Ro ribonucleoprotein n=1 Tax=Galendromus occidentalis TaxID=34638 RepID=A0AAJ7SEK2_9ACAR|nr:60 kDa SS-A/Ro ribonucleoprotein [Galendromus occidentalis]
MSASSPGEEVSWRRLRRFLFMGSESNRYLRSKRHPCIDNAFTIKELIHRGRGLDVVVLILRYSTEKISICPEALAFSLAVCAQSTDIATKSAAYGALKQVCNTAATLFAFTKYMEDTQRPLTTGWGRAHRSSVKKWYLSHNTRELAEMVTKTVSRYRWSHRDVLRLAHVKPPSLGVSCVFRYVSRGFHDAKEKYGTCDDLEVKDTLTYLQAVYDLKQAPTAAQAAKVMKNNPLAVEHIPTRYLHARDVWLACMSRAPIESILEWLPHLAHSNLLRPSLGLLRIIMQRISCDSVMTNCPWDPCATYVLMRTICSTSIHSTLPPTPEVPPTARQLQEILYNLHMASFKQMRPTLKNYLIVTDVSNGMWHSGSAAHPVTAIEASILLAMSLCRQEGLVGGRVQALAFGRAGLHDLEINQKMTMADLLERCEEVDPGTASLCLPLRWASQRNNEFDVIIVCTDRQCNTVDTVHPAEALKDYRRICNVNDAKYVTCAWFSRGFAVAPPDEAGMLDVCCFDENIIKIIVNFALDNI